MPDRTDRDIFDDLSQASRRLAVGRKLPDGDLPWPLIEQVRDDLRRYQNVSGMSIKEVSHRMGEGFSRGTLSRWLNASEDETYGLDMTRIARAVNQYIETEAQRCNVRRPQGWVETDAARRMLLVVAKTIELSSIGLIYSDAGRGKTLTLQAANAIFPGSILVRVRKSSSAPRGITWLIQRAISERRMRATDEMLENVIGVLRESGRCVMIDEAHRLSLDALEIVRDIHDETGVPIVLCGTAKINEATSDADAFFGQFSSRIALRYDITERLRSEADPRNGPGHTPTPLHTVDEIRRLYESDKVRFTADGIDYLTDLSNLLGHGGLRLCTRVVMLAAQLAQDQAIDAALLKRVIRRMHGREHAGLAIDRAMDRSLVRIGAA